MRLQRLVPQMLRHLGDFPRRLRESCHAVYEYLPCPPVGYPEIEVGLQCVDAPQAAAARYPKP